MWIVAAYDGTSSQLLDIIIDSEWHEIPLHMMAEIVRMESDGNSVSLNSRNQFRRSHFLRLQEQSSTEDTHLDYKQNPLLVVCIISILFSQLL